MTNDAAPGPLDVLLVEFPAHAVTEPVAAELAAVLDSGVVRLFDIAAVCKDDSGRTTRVDVGDGAPGLGGFEAFAGAASGLFDDSDVDQAGEVLEPGTSGLLIAIENTWASGVVGAVARAEGQVVASERIPAQELLDALDATELAD